MYTMTPKDEQAGYPKTKALLKTWNDKRLYRERREMLRAGFDRVFGHNARKALRLIEDEISARRIGLSGPNDNAS